MTTATGTTLDVRDLVRRIVRESSALEVEDLASEAVLEIPDDLLREALRQAFLPLVRAEIKAFRKSASNEGGSAPDEQERPASEGDSDDDVVAQPAAAPAPSRRVSLIRSVAAKLQSMVAVENGSLKKLAELTRADLLYLAEKRRAQSEALRRQADAYQRAAELVGDGVLGDLSQKVLADILPSQEDLDVQS